MGALLVITLLTLGCGGPTTEVRDNYDPDADWGRVHTFVWFGIQAHASFNAFDVKRLANAIRDELRRKGLTIVGDRADADVGVAAYLGVRPKAVDTWKSNGGLLWTKEKDLVSAGTLVVDVIDLRRGKLIWQGAAERPLASNPSTSDTERTVKEVVKKLFAGFPPS